MMEWLLIGALLMAFATLGSARLGSCIRAVALQGACLSLAPLCTVGALADPHRLFLATASFLIKTVAIPALLFKSLRQAKIQQAVAPTISLHLSLLGGGGLLVGAFLAAGNFSLPTDPYPPLIVPVALAIIAVGFFLLIARTKAITQVIGFLVLENGVFLFGITLLGEFPLTVELGVFLDLLVGVFVMGIMIHHINRTFDHVDTKALTALKDSE
ncbi:MAG: hydrogenase [Deltaproteobacteria bacterium]|nr:hydrogenase [Deltaproteobacteria bacterium]